VALVGFVLFVVCGALFVVPVWGVGLRGGGGEKKDVLRIDNLSVRRGLSIWGVPKAEDYWVKGGIKPG